MNMLLNFGQKLRQAAASSWFSYIAILLLQLKLIWGCWKFRDLTSGDTSSYYLMASDWLKTWHVAICWSPLYTSFYGSLMYFADDAYIVTTAHRIIIVLVLAVLVLALMRQLLPPGIAWLTAAWWVVLPIDFNSLYEVHLFAVIPVLLSVLVILWVPGAWGRGWGTAGLVIAAVLMRNELVPAAALFGLICAVWEYRRLRREAKPPFFPVRAYAFPLAAAFLLISFFYWRASDAGQIRAVLNRKHTLNVCQVYAVGYQQRHSDFQGSPWTECQQLMQRDFGKPEPSMSEALRRNPRAIIEHLLWNAQLIPNGLQVLLFQGMSGRVNPDYPPVNLWPVVLPISLLALAIAIAGLIVVYRERGYWWSSWLKNRLWAWTALGCIACAMPAVMLSQRPRPSYLFVLGIALRAVLALSAFALLHKHKSWKRLDALVPMAAVLLLALAPRYYYWIPHNTYFTDMYETIAPYRNWIQLPGTGLVTVGWGQELCSYVGHSGSCRGMSFQDLRRRVNPEFPLHRVLDESRATVFFADAITLGDPLARDFVAEAGSYGWHRIAMRHDGDGNWDLLIKNDSPAPPAP